MTGTAAKTGAALLGVTHPHTSGRTRALIEKSIPILGAWDDDPVIEPFTKKFEIPNRCLDAILDDRDVNIVLIHSKSHSMVSLASAALRAGKAVRSRARRGAGKKRRGDGGMPDGLGV